MTHSSLDAAQLTVTYVEYQDRVPCSRLPPGQALTVAGIWGFNKEVKDLFWENLTLPSNK